MSVSASEIERLEASKKAPVRRRYTEEFRAEAVQYYLKARELDPKRTIKDCAGELGVNEKTFNDWVVKFRDAGKVTRARTDGQVELDRVKRENERLRKENEFLKKAAAFFARDLA